MNIFSESNGITLVALVITIIVLLLLSGSFIGIYNNSIMDKAVLANAKMNDATIKEKKELNKSDLNIVEYLNSPILLKGNVKVGDYIDYPIEYDDVYTNVHYDSSNGWRIVDDGIMQGTSGKIKIISSHIPAKFLYDPFDYNNNVENVIYDLTVYFENKKFNIGFSGKKVKGEYFKISNLSNCVTTLTLEDLNNAYNSLYNTQRETNSIEKLNENDDLFRLNGPAHYYWILSNPQKNNLDMYCMSEHGIMTDSEMRFGIRPIIVLNDDLEGKYSNGLWIIN